MSRVVLSEFTAKSIIIGKGYRGMQVRSGEKVAKPKDAKARYVAKVDQGVKKRFKQGLVAVDVSFADAIAATKKWEKKGFTQFIIEPMISHDASEEKYLSLERVREGVRVLFAGEGGVDIEAHPEKVETYIVKKPDDASKVARTLGVPEIFFENLLKTFDEAHFAFLEINPLIVRGDEVFLLDAALLVDSAGAFFTRGKWSEDDVVGRVAKKHPAEARVNELDATTPASLKLTVVDPDAEVFFLLSAGGGSIVIADQVQLSGAGKKLGNFGEYSGGPTREETYLYAKEILGLLVQSKSKKKALVIAGPVANFTDVKKTFLGIIDALTEVAPTLRKQGVKIYVRRGGPNEAAGLALMKDFLVREQLFGSLYGSEALITAAVTDALNSLA